MLVVMHHAATPDQIQTVVDIIVDMGYQARPIPGGQRTAIGVVGNDGRVDSKRLEGLPGVVEVIHVSAPYKLVSREWRAESTVIDVGGGLVVGGQEIVVMAGPCAVESEEQVMATAAAVKQAGARMLRGGAFKPRTSPYAFQGLGLEGLKLLARARDRFGLKIVTEAIDHESIDMVEEYADIIQIGARNMQNFSLLKRAGQALKPVLLKRGLSATFKEFLLAAEYLLAEGNERVILCERGVRSFEDYTRNMMDLAAIPSLKQLSHLPIITDPSHGTGRRTLVAPMGLAAVAAGSDGLIIEVHPDPDRARSDGPQSLYPGQFADLMDGVRSVAAAVGRTVASVDLERAPA
ncbi:MAG: 3-deoxy-7-phosphoheptulonate synthase [Candidatus Sericytochromatia bacterium]|nr:3-deoxy-7-phosphoheptulonate synthase [Candidatus Tanganyikabacteria bacterium]